jgi:hypothetical protein
MSRKFRLEHYGYSLRLIVSRKEEIEQQQQREVSKLHCDLIIYAS